MIISVIVPLYKGKKYIQNIIQMCRNNIEKLGTVYKDISIELVLVNDYPDEFIDNIPSVDRLVIKCINNPVNVGIHASRIRGIDMCEGCYILMLDQDDEIADNYLVSQLAALKNSCGDLSVSNGFAEEADGKRMLYRFSLMQITVRSIWFYAVFNSRIISPGQCLIKKSIIPKEWLVNPLQHSGSDDYMLWLMLLSRKVKFSLNRECVYTHCYTGENTSLNNEKIHASVNEVIDISRKTGIVREKYLKLIENRIEHERGTKRSIWYSIEELVRRVGECFNRNGKVQ